MPKIKILFLAANPEDTPHLDLDSEVEAITKELDKEGIKDKFAIIKKMDATADDISNYFLDEKPDIVHFSGHGSRANQIYLLDEKRKKSVPVGPKVLSMLFKALKENIRCVVLNACFSEVQALVISKYVDCVVGMTRAIGDGAAIKFAQGFYRGLGNGKNVETAFVLGCFQIGAYFPDEHTIPQIMWKNNETQRILFLQKQEEKIEGISKRKLTWKQAEQAADKIVTELNQEQFDPTLIVGIGRGGAIMGALISGLMGKKPLLAFDRKYDKNGERKNDLLIHFKLPSKYKMRVLLVTGEVHTGTTVKLYEEYLKKIGAKRIYCATFYLQEDCKKEIKYSGIETSEDFLMPWVFT